MTTRAMLIAPTYTVVDGDRFAPTPADSWGAGLGGLLDRLAGSFDREGVALLAREAAQLVAIGDDGEGDQDHPAMRSAADRGWKAAKLGRWATFTSKGRPAVHLGLWDLIDPAFSPLWAIWPPDTVGSLAAWHEMTGSAYHHSPGAAGVSVLIEQAGWSAAWTADAGPTAEKGATEASLGPNSWRAATMPPAGTVVTGWDKHAAGLAAATCTLVARKGLAWTGKRTFGPKVAGWWKVERTPWQYGDVMPDPYGPGKDGPVVWVTSPTLTLVHQLADQGIMAPPLVVDSYTAPATEVVKCWGDRLSAALKTAQERAAQSRHPRSQDAARVAAAIKTAAGEATGLIGSPRSARVRRYDWYAALVAMQRCNAWRVGWKMQLSGRGPLWFEGDKIVFPGAEPPDGVKLGDGTGCYYSDGGVRL